MHQFVMTVVGSRSCTSKQLLLLFQLLLEEVGGLRDLSTLGELAGKILIIGIRVNFPSPFSNIQPPKDDGRNTDIKRV